MSHHTELDPGEREFFSLVAQAAFSNPFGEARDRIDRELGGADERAPREEVLGRLLHNVARQVDALEADGRADLRRHSPADRRLLEGAFLFEIFHRCIAQMDQLILDQLAAGAAPCPVPFAREMLALLGRRGFERPAAVRFLGIAYQMRRAFYFIDRELVGRCPSMRILREALWNDVFTHDVRHYVRYLCDRMEDFSTLLLGETGTGKGAAAAAIGRSGMIPYDEKRRCFPTSFTASFIAINLSQFPETLIESELFGHRKGAFTGAVEDHDGLLERCSPHGAIFLDEIGEVREPVQIKLLQVLQERLFSPVGSHQRQRFHGRVIAATNQPIDRLRRAGRFRDDFYYRLCSDQITVPPLRQRLAEDPAELDLLLPHVIERLVGEPAAELVALVRECIDRDLGPDYGWPGNVRELEQCARRALLVRSYRPDAGAGAARDVARRLIEGIEGGAIDARELLAGYCLLLYQRNGTYEGVARRTGLDRRTVKKHVEAARR